MSEYFKALGYGNKCQKCKIEADIINMTENLLELKCPRCGKTWGHQYS